MPARVPGLAHGRTQETPRLERRHGGSHRPVLASTSATPGSILHLDVPLPGASDRRHRRPRPSRGRDGPVILVEHRSPDGAPFPVVFADAAAAAHPWHVDLEHAATAMTPLADAVRRVGQPGEARAYAECGVTMPALLAAPTPLANGFAYHRAFELTDEEWVRLGRELRALIDARGGSFEVWRDAVLPGVRASCDWLASAPTTTPFAVLAERREHAWGLTSVAGIVARTDERAVADLCRPAYGNRATAVAYELAQGSVNETTTADAALVAIAALDPGSAAEARARAAFLAAHGGRAIGWPIDEPTLAERPDLVDAQVALLRRHGAGHGGAALAERRRDRLAATVEATLDGRDRDRFRRRLARLAAFVPVREARARWQLLATGAMRTTVLRRGAELERAGILDRADDVRFLEPAEYDDPPHDVRDAMPARRAEHRRWCAVVPPPKVGGVQVTGAEPVVVAVEPGADPGGATERTFVTGVAGAPGVATGTARVIAHLDEIDRLGPGDVLVTTMTSPAWTPLFTIAAAVVTDAGDALSHVAIAAREYGIPCVAGTGTASVHNPDGTTVTVDGDAGTVQSS